MSVEEIKNKSDYSFKRMVKIKMIEFTLNYLLDIKQRHSKMDNLQYAELKLQKYSVADDISVKEATHLFGFRTRVA